MRVPAVMLNPVPRDQIEPLWPWVLKGLEETASKHALDWTFEELRSALVMQKAFLYTWGQDDGFCVLRRGEDRHGAYLMVWVMWGPGQHEACRAAIHSDLDLIAKSVGATRIQCRGRRGWAKLGFEIVDTIMERKVW